MIKRVTGDIFQIGSCIVGEKDHEAVRVYIIKNAGRPILIDCGSHIHRREIMRDLEEVLQGEAPAFVFLTHSELPHAGNLAAIAEKWPDIQVIVSSILLKYIEIAPILPLDRITAVMPGESRIFAGRRLQFINALLKDQPGSQWIYDPLSGTLFTGDGFGAFHSPEACTLFNDELPPGSREPDFRPYHALTFRFFRWIVPEKMNAALDSLQEAYDIRVLAPTHANAIRSQIPEQFSRLKTSISEICLDYDRTGED